jgi:hypothetical protein
MEYGGGRSLEEVRDCFELANALCNSYAEIQDDKFRSITHLSENVGTRRHNAFAFLMYYIFSQYSFPIVFLLEPGLDECRTCIAALLRFSRAKRSLVIICDKGFEGYRQTLLSDLRTCAEPDVQVQLIHCDQFGIGQHVEKLQKLPKLTLFGHGFCTTFLNVANFPLTKLLINGPSVGVFERVNKIAPLHLEHYGSEFERLKTFENLLRLSHDFFLETTAFFAFRSKNYQDYS